MARASVHTFAVDGGWVNQRDRSGVVGHVYRTRAEAHRAGEDIAKRDHTEHVMHSSSGKVQTRSSFG